MKNHLFFFIILLSVIFFFHISGYSQQLGDNALYVDKSKKEIRKEKKPESKFSLNFNAGPQFSDVSGTGSLYSKGRTGYFTTFTVDYNILKNLKIGTGLSYEMRGFNLFFYSQLIIDTIMRTSYSIFDVNYDINYLTIPVNVKYIVGEGKFNLLLEGSFFYSIFLYAHKKGYTNIYIDPDDYQSIDPEDATGIEPGDNKIEYDENTNIFIDNEKFSNFDIGFIFYIGVVYNVSNNIKLNLSPGFSSNFGRLLDNPAYKSFKWSRNIKINAGITYNLK